MYRNNPWCQFAVLFGVISLTGFGTTACGGCSQKADVTTKPRKARSEVKAPSDNVPVKESSSETSKRPGKVRPAILAGTSFSEGWYPGSPEQLRSSIEDYLNKASISATTHPMGLIAPHAGHRWSGQTAAYAYKAVQGKSYRRIFILSPNHRVTLQGAAVPSVSAFATPLGEVPVDTQITKALSRHEKIVMDDRPHAEEHAIEIQLPFIQVAIKPGYKIVPVIIGEIDVQEAKQLADAIKPHISANDLVITSSDFTHFGRRFGYMPFDSDIAANLKKLDFGALEQIRKISVEGLAQYKQKTGISVCGYHPILVLLALMPEKSQAQLLHYDTSGAQTNDFSSSVSYLAISLTGPGWPKRSQVETQHPAVPEQEGPQVLSPEEQQVSLKLVRSVVEQYVRHRKKIKPEELGIVPSKNLRENYGVFVTLTKHGQLRGCIGNILPVMPLIQGMIDRAIDAAVNDRRFNPVQSHELDEIEIEISVLTRPRLVSKYEQIVIGRHGVVLSKGERSAVYLPQVAPEQGWNLEQTLYHLSRKAGLPGDAWQTGARFEVFEAQVFKEK